MRLWWRHLWLGTVAGGLLLPWPAATAQTLARPGWAGSGLAGESWWHSAVFYRVDVRHFQDSDGDGVGDLRGLAQRLDYVQALGADAVVLLPPVEEQGFDELLREASGRHIRLVVALPLIAGQTPERTAALARQWLSRGAAGIYLQRAVPAGGRAAGGALPDASAVLRQMRLVADGYPGQRVVLSEFSPGLSLAGTSGRGRGQHADSAELVDLQIVSGNDVLRREMNEAQASPDVSPLLLTDARFRSANAYFAEGPEQQLGLNKILATVLMTFHGAVSLRYGQELGLAAEAGGDAPRTMQWTPANVMTAAATPKPPANPDVFGPYVPYVAPVKTAGKPAPDPVADANRLRGFSTAALEAGGGNGMRANVALEDADPASLLNFYRKLAQLHRGNASVRNGTPYILSEDVEQALVWVRRAPAGARTAGNVVVACNRGDTPLVLSVRRDLERLHLASGTLRPLLASWTENPEPQDAGRIVLPPYSVFVGELARR